jgi:twitching motility protein PilT
MDEFHRILAGAASAGASDIHLKAGAPIVFRINRELNPVDAPPPAVEWVDAVVKTIVPPHLRKRFDEEGEVDFSYLLPGVGRFRTNVFRQRGQSCIAMRAVKTEVPSFEALGLPPVVKKFAETPRGIVLLAGSTGAGKSTTLAAMIQHINTHSKKHIVTLEDPIEYTFEEQRSVIEQREIGLDTLTFEHALKNILRQDPDVIMLGEMRDAVSFSAAMRAADTGHLVLSTVHTTNAAQSVTRVLEFFKADEREQVRRQLAGTLVAVICQRMVPTIAGGITPALEILINTSTVRSLIEENRIEKLPAAIETGGEDGMQNFNQALFKLVKEGKITQEAALAKASNPDALRMNFKGIFLTEERRILG